MTNTTAGARCAFEPTDKRSAYIVLTILVTIGLCAIVAGVLSTAQAKPALQPYAQVSADRIITTATHRA